MRAAAFGETALKAHSAETKKSRPAASAAERKSTAAPSPLPPGRAHSPQTVPRQTTDGKRIGEAKCNSNSSAPRGQLELNGKFRDCESELGSQGNRNLKSDLVTVAKQPARATAQLKEIATESKHDVHMVDADALDGADVCEDEFK